MLTRPVFAARATCLATVAALWFGLAPSPAIGQTTKAPVTPKAQEKAKGKAKADLVNVNTASAEELETLPGVGPALSKAIVAGRPYKTMADLGEVKGMGEAKLADLKGLVTFSTPSATTPKAEAAKEKATAKTETATREKMEKAEAKKTESSKEKAEARIGSPVNVNTASTEQLETLPGVGPAMSKAIIAGRPYKTMADLGEVKGMGEAKLGALKGLVSFGTPASATTPKAEAAKEKATATAKTEATKEKMEKAKVAAKEKEEEPATTKPKVTLPPGKKVNINTASVEELDSLFGIGPARAKLIIEGRPYEKIEDIMKVKGIKEVTFEKMKDAITVK